MVLKLYFDFMSQPSRALYIFFKACRIPFESHIVKISQGQHLTEEYEKINPHAKLPAIEHDGFKLIESIAILRYISREFKVDDHWFPKDSKAQAKIDEYLEWQHLNLRLHCSRYAFAMVFNPMARKRPPHPERKKECESNLFNCLNTFENIWLKNNAFITGDKISIADLFAACEIQQTRMGNYKPSQDRPKLARWLDRVARETSPYFIQAHENLESVIARIDGRPTHTCSIEDVFQ